MSIKGFLEAVEPFQVRGWAYDTECPETSLSIEILVNGKSAGSTTANLYRPDLERNAIGSGNHAFAFYFPEKVDQAELPNVSARIQLNGESYYTLDRWRRGDPRQKATLSFNGTSVDEQHAPVFVLGAARSGTTAIVEGLLKTGQFKGYPEGHVLDLLMPLSGAVAKFYEQKRNEAALTSDTMLSLVQQDYFDRALDQIFLKITQGLLWQVRWVEKTPNADMISLAPRLKRIWPKSRFIFMKRRFFEYSLSRARKFAKSNFLESCMEWKHCMATWTKVRSSLKGDGLEIDQHYLSEAPEQVASTIMEFLGLSETEAKGLAEAFRLDRPERTSGPTDSRVDLESMKWDAAELLEFKQTCQRWMNEFGYSSDVTYFQPGFEDQKLVRV